MEHNKDSAPVTMKDVARRAGVSTATVSRALMKPDKVAFLTRQKIKQAAIETGYSLWPFMQSTKPGASRTILITVPNICDPFFSEIIRGAEMVATRQDYLVLISDGTYSLHQGKPLINLLLTRQVDGAILLGAPPPFNPSPEEQPHLPPMVMVNEYSPEQKLPTVHIDNLTAAFNAVKYLWQLGHRRIACLTGPETLPTCRYRLQGYIQALRRHGLSVDPQYIVSGEMNYEAGAAAVKQLLSLSAPPDALFCHNDRVALGAMAQAKSQGLCIPQDLSLVGFDDTELARFSDPTLTTVAQPRFQLGCEAMHLLLKQLQGDVINNGSYLLESELKIRGSTACRQPVNTASGYRS